MKKIYVIDSQYKLINHFQDISLKMKKNTVITFHNNLQLGSNILFEGKINLGKNNKIDSNCNLKNIIIGDNNHIRMSSLINDTKISNNVIVGPFAFIRDKTKIEKNSIIGAYVEVARSYINQNVYASHRAFIGDASIGKNTIIGAGTVFCNFNFISKKKQKTNVGNDVKIGSNSTIMAPIKIKAKSIIPASSKVKASNLKLFSRKV